MVLEHHLANAPQNDPHDVGGVRPNPHCVHVGICCHVNTQLSWTGIPRIILELAANNCPLAVEREAARAPSPSASSMRVSAASSRSRADAQLMRRDRLSA